MFIFKETDPFILRQFIPIMSLRITEDLEENETESKKGLEIRYWIHFLLSFLTNLYNSYDFIFRLCRITKEVLRKHCIKHDLYTTPHLNDVLYLHFKGS